MADLDYRAMCAELLAWAEHTSSHYYKQPDVLDRARALLAQPKTEGLTEEELRQMLFDDHRRSNIGAQPLIFNEGRTVRGNGNGGPTTPKPDIIPQGQGPRPVR